MASGEVVWWIVTDLNGNIKVISTTLGSAADNALKSSNPQATIGGTDYIALETSSYPSEEAANAALPGIKKFEQGKGPGTPTVPPFALGPNQPAGQAAQQAGQDVTGLANPLDALKDVAAAMEAFYSALTDGKMWRSVAWILLGMTLMLTGILLWLKVPQRAAGAAAKAALLSAST